MDKEKRVIEFLVVKVEKPKNGPQALSDESLLATPQCGRYHDTARVPTRELRQGEKEEKRPDSCVYKNSLLQELTWPVKYHINPSKASSPLSRAEFKL